VPHHPDASLGLTWRALTPDDLDLWLTLEQAIESADEASERFDRDDLLDELADGSWKDPAHDSLVGLDEQGTPRAFGLVEALPGATLRRMLLWGGVHPDWRRRGVGRELLRWQVDRAHEKLETPPTEPVPALTDLAVDPAWLTDTGWRIQLSHPQRLADRSALARAAGMQPVRYFHDLVRELTTPGAPPVPQIPLPEPLELLPYLPAHAERLRLAHNEAFAGHWGSQPRTPEAWRTQLVDQRNFRPDWTFLAIDPTRRDDDGLPAVAGYVTGAAFEQDFEPQGYTAGWTGLLGVRPAWRGRRLAPALLAAQLRAFAASGMEKAGLDVDTGNASGALALYTGLGYEVESTSVVWALEG
jgi:ribosomal protein S18 acetylase RimI-like enzyme